MKIQYASDLHLEFGSNTAYLRKKPLLPVGDILVLAGDIGYLSDDHNFVHPFWDWAGDHYDQVIVIPGNHELYNFFDINEFGINWQFKIRGNVRYVNNSVIRLDDFTDLIATTLWAKIPSSNAEITESRLSDFRRILDGDNFLSWKRFNEEHQRCRNFLTKSIENSMARNIIVATHHVPAAQLMAEEFSDSPLNGAFTAELSDYIAASKIKYWIYGHSHRNIDKVIGNTCCVSNQLGYVSLKENLGFRPDAVIVV